MGNQAGRSGKGKAERATTTTRRLTRDGERDGKIRGIGERDRDRDGEFKRGAGNNEGDGERDGESKRAGNNEGEGERDGERDVGGDRGGDIESRAKTGDDETEGNRG